PQQLQSNATTLLEQADMRGVFASTAMSHADKAQLNTRVQAFVRAIAGMRVPEVLGHVAAMAKQQEKALRAGLGFDFELLSIEEAKGQEFDCVALPFLEPGRFPAPAPK